MKLRIWKYQGTGNDFIMLDGITGEGVPRLSKTQIETLCSRRFGIGADGLIILAPSDTTDFKMVYYNSDGAESSMCGNGGRCIAKFAVDRKVCAGKVTFEAIDGLHEAIVGIDGTVDLQMVDVDLIQALNTDTYKVDTGSPHYVHFSDQFDEIDIEEFGKSIRYSDQYASHGINVNVVRLMNGELKVKTYERGVEAETFSCGTGVTAAALSASVFSGSSQNEFYIETKGGHLTVRFDRNENTFKNIWLCGPATFVFEGAVEL